MISDTLYEAISEIDKYLYDYPDDYAPYRDKIVIVREAMDKLRQELDKQPWQDSSSSCKSE
jgi:hypothetical protein